MDDVNVSVSLTPQTLGRQLKIYFSEEENIGIINGNKIRYYKIKTCYNEILGVCCGTGKTWMIEKNGINYNIPIEETTLIYLNTIYTTSGYIFLGKRIFQKYKREKKNEIFNYKSFWNIDLIHFYNVDYNSVFKRCINLSEYTYIGLGKIQLTCIKGRYNFISIFVRNSNIFYTVWDHYGTCQVKLFNSNNFDENILKYEFIKKPYILNIMKLFDEINNSVLIKKAKYV